MVFTIVGSILGILGFAISLANAIYFFISRKVKLTIHVVKYYYGDSSNSQKACTPYFSFENNSQLPISITRIQLVIGETRYESQILPQMVEEYSRRRKENIFDTKTVHSIAPPINLAPLEAFSGYVLFQIPPDMMSAHETGLTFRICTNRGKIIQRTFGLDENVLIR